MEVDRRIVARRMTPAMLAAGPSGADDRTGRQVDQRAVTRLRSGIMDQHRIDADREVPGGDDLRLRRCERIGPGIESRRQDGRVLDLAGEMPSRRVAMWVARRCRRDARIGPERDRLPPPLKRLVEMCGEI